MDIIYEHGLGLIASVYSLIMAIEYSTQDINLFLNITNLNIKMYLLFFRQISVI